LWGGRYATLRTSTSYVAATFAAEADQNADASSAADKDIYTYGDFHLHAYRDGHVNCDQHGDQTTYAGSQIHFCEQTGAGRAA
jgi:hypothetical protein